MGAARKGVLFTGGDGPALNLVESVVRGADVVMASDSGWDLALSLGIIPAFVVGDMDSIRDKEVYSRLPADHVFVFEQEKDETDTEIGLRMLFEQGVTDVSLVGGGGGRLDHLIAILALFDRDKVRPSRWYTGNEEVASISDDLTLHDMKGRRCSFFPVGQGPWEVRTTGLKWALDDLRWKRGDVGVSNYGTQESVTLNVVRGRLIMVRDLTEAENG